MLMAPEKIRDSQRSAVYSWERQYIAPYDLTGVPFEQIQNIVNYVWQQEGLEYPPRVELLPKNAKRIGGDATRLRVRFHEDTKTWIILHELSHSMTSTIDDTSNQHGALFMGVYIQLVSRFLKMDFAKLMESAESAGLDVKPDARPVFL